MKTIFDRAIHEHLPVPMQRDGVERMFGIGIEELKLLLEPFDFHTEVLFEDQGVSIWLREFSIYGSGEDFDDAKSALEENLDEVLLAAPRQPVGGAV